MDTPVRPVETVYGLPPRIPGNPESMVVAYPPTNKQTWDVTRTNFANEKMVFTLPTSLGIVLARSMTLVYTVTNTSTGAAGFLQAAFWAENFLRRLEILNGQNSLELEDKYNLIASFLNTAAQRDYSLGTGNVVSNTSEDLEADAFYLDSGASRQFAVPVISGLLYHSEDVIPLGLATLPLRLEWGLEDPAIAMNMYNNAQLVPSYRISNVSLTFRVLTGVDELLGLLRKAQSAAPIMWNVPTYRVQTDPMTQATRQTVQIEVSKNLMSMWHLFTDLYDLNNVQGYPLQRFSPNSVDTYQYTFGETRFPANPITCGVDALNDSFHHFMASVGVSPTDMRRNTGLMKLSSMTAMYIQVVGGVNNRLVVSYDGGANENINIAAGVYTSLAAYAAGWQTAFATAHAGTTVTVVNDRLVITGPAGHHYTFTPGGGPPATNGNAEHMAGFIGAIANVGDVTTATTSPYILANTSRRMFGYDWSAIPSLEGVWDGNPYPASQQTSQLTVQFTFRQPRLAVMTTISLVQQKIALGSDGVMRPVS